MQNHDLHNGVICEVRDTFGLSLEFILSHALRMVRRATRKKVTSPFSPLPFDTELHALMYQFNNWITLPQSFLEVIRSMRDDLLQRQDRLKIHLVNRKRILKPAA